MADWHGTCRSNYFNVKNFDAFIEMLSDFDVALIQNGDGQVGFVSTDEYGSIPVRFEEDHDDPTGVCSLIAEHLAEGQVCVILEAGAERARYITGVAIAIHSSGERVELRLNDIYDLAKAKFGVTEIVEAVY